MINRSILDQNFHVSTHTFLSCLFFIHPASREHPAHLEHWSGASVEQQPSTHHSASLHHRRRGRRYRFAPSPTFIRILYRSHMSKTRKMETRLSKIGQSAFTPLPGAISTACGHGKIEELHLQFKPLNNVDILSHLILHLPRKKKSAKSMLSACFIVSLKIISSFIFQFYDTCWHITWSLTWCIAYIYICKYYSNSFYGCFPPFAK